MTLKELMDRVIQNKFTNYVVWDQWENEIGYLYYSGDKHRWVLVLQYREVTTLSKFEVIEIQPFVSNFYIMIREITECT